ncbi:MAG TPA: hypothetical protein VKB25_02430 [Conexibacter sp.]|nr:hypothetical protein [Conexibacter sp.]
MATSSAGTREDPAAAGADAPRALEPAEVAWLAVLPCAVVIVAAILLLGPPLGHALFEPTAVDRFWPQTWVLPEPVEHARFVLALLAAPLGAAAVAAGGRWRPRLRPSRTRILIALTQTCTVLFLALMLLAQHNVLLRSYVYPVLPVDIFSVPSLVAAAVLAPLLGFVLQRRTLVARLAGLARETRGRRIGCTLVAVVLIAVWLLAAFNTEHTIGKAESNHLIPWDMSETFAVLDGRTPLVDYHSQYAQLLPYVAAAALRVVGTSVGAWTGTMIVLSGLALLAVFAVLRRVVRSSVAALALFVPFLAGSTFLIFSHLSPVEIFSLWPMRYGGPYLLAWLTARHLDGAAPRSRWLVAGVAGLVALNNLEFGLPACAGVLVAIAYVDPPRSRRSALRLLAEIAAGLAGAVVIVSVIALVHGGALPHFGLMLEFPRIYGISGWVLEPMAAAGLHIAVFATFVAAAMVATVRAVRGDEGRVLTGMLVWSGIFGLGAGSYFAGRSDSLNLISLFSAWCLALVLLAVVVVERVARSGRRPSLGDLVVLFGCSLVALSVFQMPRPWAEVERLQQTTRVGTYKQAAAIRLVSETTTPGQKVAILIPLGHRIAYDAGVVNVAPYSGIESMPTVGQLARTLAVARREGASQLYIDVNPALTTPAIREALVEAGWTPGSPETGRYLMLQAPSS